MTTPHVSPLPAAEPTRESLKALMHEYAISETLYIRAIKRNEDDARARFKTAADALESAVDALLDRAERAETRAEQAEAALALATTPNIVGIDTDCFYEECDYDGLAALTRLANDCPACIAAAMKQNTDYDGPHSREVINFDYKTACIAWAAEGRGKYADQYRGG